MANIIKKEIKGKKKHKCFFSTSNLPHLKELSELDYIYLSLFWNNNRFCSYSYKQLCEKFNLKSRYKAKHLIELLSEAGLVRIEHTSYKGTKISGINKYFLTTKGNKYLQAIIRKGMYKSPIPASCHPLFKLENGAVKKLLKSEIAELESYSEEKRTHKEKTLRVVNKNICQEREINHSKLDRSPRFSKIKEVFSRFGCFQRLNEANDINLKHLLKMPIPKIKKVLKKMRKTTKRIRHFWKFFTWISNQTKEVFLNWYEKQAKRLSEAMRDPNKKEGPEIKQIIEGIRTIQKCQGKQLTEKDLLALAKESKSEDFVKLKNAIDITVWKAKRDNPETISKETKMPFIERTIRGEKIHSKFYYYKCIDFETVRPTLPAWNILGTKIYTRTKEEAIEYCRKRNIPIPQEPKKENPQEPKRKIQNYMGFLIWLLRQNFKDKDSYFKSLQGA